MRKKTKIAIALIWQGFIALISPIWIGFIYMFITGHGKGYSYDLRSETDISIMIGAIALIFLLVATLPVSIWLGNTFYHKEKWMWVIPILLFVVLFAIAVMLIGFNNFLSMFGL
ncbi:hypothetical protein [Caproicibacter fermentans]|uniref:Uncharacterized protein n=1 Tax=Caproicibacter fermentans TaxID=2576756 RepID=A0A7G8TA65_9FIRM|nr:hypothetical protein [Caproicibacter fermentans]QNK40506.1 hypothetical protein HCR03_17985 [Caproicibacter fermentans]